MPQVIQTFGLDPLAIGFVTAIPYLVASIGMILWSWHSDATGERVWHLALPFLLAAAAFAWSATAGGNLTVTMIALSLATLGIFAAMGPFWSLPPTILTGTAAAAGFALINSIGNVGGLVSPALIGNMKEATGTFTAALLFLAGALLVGACMALLFGRVAGTRIRTRPRACGYPISSRKAMAYHWHPGLVEWRIKPAMTKRIDDDR